MHAFEVVGLSKSFKGKSALCDVSMVANAGELVGLIGANGAGKTTLFQAAAALISVDSGAVSIMGHSRGTHGARVHLGYLPEDPKLWPYLTVAEHLQFIARAYAVDGWRAKAETLLARLKLEEARDSLGATLSQGMRRKVGLAMVLMHNSSVLLLDEPFNGLDPEAQHELRNVLREQVSAGTSIVMSSHRLAELQTLATNFVVIARGKTLIQGDLAALQQAAGKPGTDLETAYLELMQ